MIDTTTLLYHHDIVITYLSLGGDTVITNTTLKPLAELEPADQWFSWKAFLDERVDEP